MMLLNPDPEALLAGPKTLPPAEFHFSCEDGPATEWHVRRFELREAISSPYALSLDLLTAGVGVDTAQLLGARCTLEICRGIDGRLVHGLVTRVRPLGVFSGRLGVRLEVAPALHLLSQQTDTRFWQNRTVPQILREVLQPALRELGSGLDMRIEEAAHAPREYCVQYRESDLDLAARLMHEDGLVYFFTHAPDRTAETLVVLDSTTRAQELDHPFRAVPYVARTIARAELAGGESDVLELLPGHTITLGGLPRPDLDGDYLLVAVTHRGDAQGEVPFTTAPGHPRYVNSFECVRAITPYRPPSAFSRHLPHPPENPAGRPHVAER